MRRGVPRPGALGRGLLAALVVVGSVGTAQATAATKIGACAQLVIDDWSKGGLDHAHSARCYRAALAALPEDTRIYSSAPDDIRRALAADVTRESKAVRKVASVDQTRTAAAPTGEKTSDAIPAPALLATSLALFLVVVASAGTLLYRRFHR